MYVEINQREEHAELGALLAKCDYIAIGHRGGTWWAWAGVIGRKHLSHGEGPTQLAAVRAAVEAAEKGAGE